MQHRAVPCKEEEEGESVTQGEKKGDCRSEKGKETEFAIM